MPTKRISTISTIVMGFLNRRCKPVMRLVYPRIYRKEILKVLRFMRDNENLGPINMWEVAEIMTLDDDNWTTRKAYEMVAICHYLGFIG